MWVGLEDLALTLELVHFLFRDESVRAGYEQESTEEGLGVVMDRRELVRREDQPRSVSKVEDVLMFPLAADSIATRQHLEKTGVLDRIGFEEFRALAVIDIMQNIPIEDLVKYGVQF